MLNLKHFIAGGLLLVALGSGLYLVLVPSGSGSPARSDLPPAAAPAPEPGTDEADARRAEMEQAYAELEDSRRQLQQRLDGLKARLWKQELPAADARKVQEGMLRGYSLLKNPLLLGAFSDPAEIERERARVEQVRAQLEEVASIIEAAPPAGNRSG